MISVDYILSMLEHLKVRLPFFLYTLYSIEKHNILSKHQFGFRKNRSTEDAILELTDKISKALDERKYTLGVFLDLSKAFDTMNHEILCKKREHYGIRGICLQWFKNYLRQRSQIVKFKQHK